MNPQQPSHSSFETIFGSRPEVVVSAPGRVNLIGEHTDYNHGFVLPMAIDRRLTFTARRNQSHKINLHSRAMDQSITLALDDLTYRPDEGWVSYVRGVLYGFRERDYPLEGFDALIESTLPVGGGLSSSAALEVATAMTLEWATKHTLQPLERAHLCQRAEHEFAKVPCGIMDQFAVVFCQANTALLLDCDTNEFRSIPIQDPEIRFLIINTNVSHELSESAYAQRRTSCQQAAEILGIPNLRQLTSKDTFDANPKLTAEQQRRTRHVFTENQRTQNTAAALEDKQWDRVGQLMYESHESLRDDYEVSCTELDVIVDILRKLPSNSGVYGARMTGGGFGGCVVALVRADQVSQISQTVEAQYTRATQIQPTLFVVRPDQGAFTDRKDL